MKRIIFSIALFASLTASAQIPYETSVFWQFLEGFQGGDSTTQNYMEYKNSSLLMRRTGSDVKVFQVKNDVSNAAVLTGFLDEQKNGGFSVDSSDGTTVVKLRGGYFAHSYTMNKYVSVGRTGNSQQYGGTVDGAKFTINCERNPYGGLGSAENYQLMIQSPSDVLNEGAGLAFVNENAAKDINVGASIVYEKLGNNGYGALEFYAKDNATDLAAPTKYMRMANDTLSFLASNIVGINTDNIYTADGTLTGDRTVTMNGNELILEGTHSFNYDLKITDLAITLPSNSATLSSTFQRAADGAILSMRNNSNVENVLIRSYASGGVQGHFTAGNIGIGTITPTQKLHIDGNVRVTGAYYDSSNLPGTSGQILSSTATGTGWVDANSIASGSAERVSILVKNGEGTALVKGDPVYIIGSVGASGRLEVGLCDAGDPDKMPCVGLLEQDLLNNGEGTAVTAGKLRNLITTPIDGQTTTENETIYVKAGGSSGLALTTTKPTGSTNLIQNVGQVGRVSSSSDGNFVVSAIMRTNDVPNLPTGRIWVGDGNTTVSNTVYIDEPNSRVGIGTTTPSARVHADNTATIGVGAIIENSDAANTDDIAQFHNSTGTVASITNDGGITASHDVTFSGGSSGANTMEWNGSSLFFNGSSNYIAFAGGVTFHGSRGMYRSSQNNGQFYFEATLGGAPYINRNVADANPSLIVHQENASSTGDIAQFWNSTGRVASISNAGDFYPNEFIYNSDESAFIRMFPTSERIRLQGGSARFEMYEDNYFLIQTLHSTGQNLLVNVGNATNTNPIAEFQKEGTTVASITNDGYITAQAATGTSDTVAIWDGTTLKKKELKNQTVFASNPYDNVLAGVSENMAIHGSGNFTASNRRFTIMPKDGIISDFWVSTQGFQDASGDLVLVLQVNFVDTPLSLTITNADGVSITKSETATSVSVSAGDLVRIKITNNATATSTNVVSSTLLYTFD